MTDMENGPIVRKTLELCQTIIDEPSFQVIRQRLDDFMADTDAQAQYQELNELGASLQQKQQMGLSTDGPDYEQFELKRQTFLKNPVAVGFLEAQESMFKVRETVTRYVTRTLELGRKPGPEDLASCGCGSSSGCGH